MPRIVVLVGQFVTNGEISVTDRNVFYSMFVGALDRCVRVQKKPFRFVRFESCFARFVAVCLLSVWFSMSSVRFLLPFCCVTKHC